MSTLSLPPFNFFEFWLSALVMKVHFCLLELLSRSLLFLPLYSRFPVRNLSPFMSWCMSLFQKFDLARLSPHGSNVSFEISF